MIGANSSFTVVVAAAGVSSLVRSSEAIDGILVDTT
jgi:hypothetical protein